MCVTIKIYVGIYLLYFGGRLAINMSKNSTLGTVQHAELGFSMKFQVKLREG